MNPPIISKHYLRFSTDQDFSIFRSGFFDFSKSALSTKIIHKQKIPYLQKLSTNTKYAIYKIYLQTGKILTYKINLQTV
tara:strand:- start:144 stop:380 length:237 start_codon:yes stop_codon:yes gene_type:complete